MVECVQLTHFGTYYVLLRTTTPDNTDDVGHHDGKFNHQRKQTNKTHSYTLKETENSCAHSQNVHVQLTETIKRKRRALCEYYFDNCRPKLNRTQTKKIYLQTKKRNG